MLCLQIPTYTELNTVPLFGIGRDKLGTYHVVCQESDTSLSTLEIVLIVAGAVVLAGVPLLLHMHKRNHRHHAPPVKVTRSHPAVVTIMAVSLALATPCVLASPSVHLHAWDGSTDMGVVGSDGFQLLDVSWRGFTSGHNISTMPEFVFGFLPASANCSTTLNHTMRSLHGFASASVATAATLSTANLRHGEAYAACVLWYNGTGNILPAPADAAAATNPFIVDTTPPDVSQAKINTTFVNRTLTVSWSGVHEDVATNGVGDAAPVVYGWSVGTSRGGAQLRAFTWLLTNTSTVTGDVAASQGATLFVTIVARNAAGMTSRIVSSPIVLDSSYPDVWGLSLWHATAQLEVIGVVDGLDDELMLRWWSRDIESGVVKTTVCVSTAVATSNSEPTCNVAVATTLPTATTWTISRRELANATATAGGSRLIFRVDVWNGAGLMSFAATPAMVVDSHLPTRGSVHVSGASYAASVEGWTPSSVLSVNWTGFEDDGSGLRGYEVAMAAGLHPPEHHSVVHFRSMSLATFAELDVAELGYKHPRVWVGVRAVDHAGQFSDPVWQDKNVSIARASAPAVTVVNAVAAVGDNHLWFVPPPHASSRNATVAVHWQHSIFEGVPIVATTVAVGTVPSSSNDSPVLAEQLASIVSNSSLSAGLELIEIDTSSLVDGAALFVSVQVTNAAGVSTTATFPQRLGIDLSQPCLSITSAGVYSATLAAWLYADKDGLDMVVQVGDAQSGVRTLSAIVRNASSLEVVGEWTDNMVGVRVPREVHFRVPLRLNGQPTAKVVVAIVATNAVGMNTTRHTVVHIDPRLPPNASAIVVDKWSSAAGGVKVSWVLAPAAYLTVEWGIASSGRTDPDVLPYRAAASGARGLDGQPYDRTTVFGQDVHLAHGQNYTAIVRVTDALGRSTVSISGVMSVDTTPPIAPAPLAVKPRLWHTMKPSVGAQSAQALLSMDWVVPFEDVESGVAQCAVMIGSFPMSDNVVGISSVAHDATTWEVLVEVVDRNPLRQPQRTSLFPPSTNPIVTPGQPLYATITCTNGAGLASELTLDVAYVDATPPTVVTVRIGSNHAQGASYITRLAVVGLNWDGFDLESSVTQARACLSVVSSLSDPQPVAQFCDTDPANLQDLRVEKDGTRGELREQDIPDGSVVVASLQLVNGAGLPSAVVRSSPALVDVSSPVAGTVHVQMEDVYLGVRMPFTPSKTSLTVSWETCDPGNATFDSSCWYDSVSGISEFLVGIGSAQGDVDVLPLSLVGLQTQKTFSRLQLAENATYWATVLAKDASGRTTMATASLGVGVDPSAATLGTAFMSNNAGENITVQADTTHLCIAWDGFQDNVSGIPSTEVAFGLRPYGEQLLPFTFVAFVSGRRVLVPRVNQAWRSDSAWSSGHLCVDVPLRSGAECYGTIRVTNGAGTPTVLATSPILVDAMAPYPPPPKVFASAVVNATDPTRPVVLAMNMTGTSRRGVREQAQKDEGAGAAYNPPIFVHSLTNVTLVWHEFLDMETTMVSQRCGLGYRRDTLDIFVLDVEPSHHTCNIASSNVLVVAGRPFFFIVEATNEAGLKTRASTVSPLILDESSPELPSVHGAVDNVTVGSGLGSGLCLSGDQILVSWAPFRDYESGIAHYTLSIEAKYGNEAIVLVPPHNVGLHRSHLFVNSTDKSGTFALGNAVVSTRPFTAAIGTLVTASVTATNHAGLESEALRSAVSLVVCHASAGVGSADGCDARRHRCVDTSPTPQLSGGTPRHLSPSSSSTAKRAASCSRTDSTQPSVRARRVFVCSECVAWC